MLRIDEAIINTDNVICENISKFDLEERGILSQNILSQIRNLVEYVAMKAMSNGKDIDPNDYDERGKLLNEIAAHGDMRFVSSFHKMLQKSVSHYTVNKDGSERLMLKYYEYLLRIKNFLDTKYDHKLQLQLEQ